MKAFIHPALTAIGLSVLCFLGYISPLISPQHLLIYQDSASPVSVFVPVLLNIGFVWLVLTFLLCAADKPGRVQVFVWSGLFFAVPLVFLKVVSQLGALVLPIWLSRTLFLASSIGFAALIVQWRPSFYPVFERARNFASTVLAFVGVGAILVLGQTLWCFWQARDIQPPRPFHAQASQASINAAPQRHRVVWIILDELSYQQVYERRFTSLDLPEFDRLANQSTLFTQVRPAAERTEYAIPSFLTGLRVDDIRAGADGNLRSLRNPVTGAWQPFQPEDTVFHDALGRGYNTAVAGWYIPYCRILATVLDRCRWTFGASADKWMLLGASIRTNTLAPWLRVASWFVSNNYTNDRFASRMAETHIADYQWLATEADKLLEDPSLNFVLLHVPAPHPGGIYNRRTGAFTTHGASYIDNLALADRYLAHVHQLLKPRGQWDSSTVIVMGDHSWRTTLLWSDQPGWTAEERAASHGGQFDPRPAYIVKLPHQTGPARIAAPFDAVNTRPLLDALLGGSIQSPADLAAFAADLDRHSLASLRPPTPR